MSALVEPSIHSIYCDGLDRVDIVGNTARFVLFTWERSTGAEFEVRPRIEIIIPLESVQPAVEMTLAAISRFAMAKVNASVKRLMC